ncbi:MAG: glycosyltransferase family 4 protein, partial [Wenzhouxiangella sp.]
MSQAVVFIVPGDPDQRTGGYLFDARIVAELRRMGWSIEVIGLDGRFPLADATARSSMASALAGQSDQALIVIDGLALGAVPEVVAGQADRLRLVALIHHPLADETGLDPATRERLLTRERMALDHCRQILVTSRFTARRLQALALTRRAAVVIEPGVEPTDLAPAARACAEGRAEPGPQTLLCVASLTPRKGQDVLASALGRLTDLPWLCRLSGSDQRDPAFAAALRRQIAQAGLGARISIPGERDARQLEADYRWASACVLASHYEGYGMVVSEALARGLPVIASTGGALADTVPGDVGLKVAPGDVDALAAALEAWLTQPSLRR